LINKKPIYYRLKIIDIDGHFEYSTVVKLGGANTSMSIYPNPTAGHVIVRGGQPGGTLQITNALGYILMQQHVYTSYQRIDVSHLKKGTYWIMYYKGKMVSVEKIIIE